MSIAIMQPYIFPYIGYFQLIHAADKFVFYDDVNYINRGWINRNRILLNQKEYLFSVPLSKASQNRLINEIETSIDDKFIAGFLNTLQQAYKKAPHYADVKRIIEIVFAKNNLLISSLAINSVNEVCSYLGIDKEFQLSSAIYGQSKELKKADRLIKICLEAGDTKYVNAYGGSEIYTKEYFDERGVQLSFLKSESVVYDQKNEAFTPWLSIIDVLMFNSPEQVRNLLSQYTLI